MSAAQSQVAATIPSPGPSESHSNGLRAPPETKPEQRARARDIVRLFQCRLCSLPFRGPVTLPCGKSLCRQCLPQTYKRVNITYPAGPDRLLGFICPFGECGKEHALDDCRIDVSLNKTLHCFMDNVRQAKGEALELGTSTHVTTGLSSPSGSIGLSGGRLVATWSLAEDGDLEFDAEVANDTVKKIASQDFAGSEVEALHKLQDEARTDMDFCRRTLAINPLLNRTVCPPNERITRIIETFWMDELTARKELLAADQLVQGQDYDIPLFVCTMSLPTMPTFLYVFEPRYRLMIRRAMDGNKTFGMVLPKKDHRPGEASFHEVGTLLRITNIQPYSDGRSLIETIGVSRFRVTSYGELDGYAVGKIERIDDVSLEDEEALEASEALPGAVHEEENYGADGPPTVGSEGTTRGSVTMEDLHTMSTSSLMHFAHDFVERMRVQGVPWMGRDCLAVYGECPNDPELFPWWLANMLPIRDGEKYRLLESSSVRERLKICGAWIIEWESRVW
ncbi:hypothetical protein ACO1O0_008161 [Amphichorda felina]